MVHTSFGSPSAKIVTAFRTEVFFIPASMKEAETASPPISRDEARGLSDARPSPYWAAWILEVARNRVKRWGG